MGFGQEEFITALTADKYISFMLSLLIIFGISFELPLLVVMLNRVGVVKYRQLKKWRRGIVFALFVFAAFATPGSDPFSMLGLAGALTVLFEMSIQLARLHDRKQGPRTLRRGLGPARRRRSRAVQLHAEHRSTTSRPLRPRPAAARRPTTSPSGDPRRARRAPGFGHGAAARIADTVAERLRAAVDRLDVLVANSVEESRELMRTSHDAGPRRPDRPRRRRRRAPGRPVLREPQLALGLVPAGTGNDFARALGIPGEPLPAVDALVAALRSGARRRIDLGRAGETWFATVLCAGFDASVNERANRMRWPSGPRRYDVAILAELAAFRSRPVVVDTRHRTPRARRDPGRRRQHPLLRRRRPDLPDADPDDGVFDVTIVGRTSRRD